VTRSEFYDFDVATTRRQGDFTVAQAQSIFAKNLFAPSFQRRDIAQSSGNTV